MHARVCYDWSHYTIRGEVTIQARMIYSEIVAGEIRKASVLYGVYRVCLSIIICKVQFGFFLSYELAPPSQPSAGY